jgi:hypothetical protein
MIFNRQGFRNAQTRRILPLSRNSANPNYSWLWGNACSSSYARQSVAVTIDDIPRSGERSYIAVSKPGGLEIGRR